MYRWLQVATAVILLSGTVDEVYALDNHVHEHEHGQHVWESKEVRSELTGQIGGVICLWAGASAAYKLMRRRKEQDNV